MKETTNCPYCGTANLINRQLLYVDKFGVPTFQCKICGSWFTDFSLKDELSTNSKQQENG